MAEASMPVPAEPTLTQMGSSSSGAGDWRQRFAELTSQPAFKKALPAIIGVGTLALAAMAYLAIAQGPQRILYSSLSDGERAKVVEALETGGISYTIENATGVITVAEDDVYRARMLVASDAGLAAPQGATEMLDSIPLGASRTLEGERLRLARERELMLTIREIDGIEAVRVHLATPERSVFVRDNASPSASVMVRLVGGRSLGQRQVEAIVNLVSGSVPNMTADAVRVVDQNGRLLSAKRDATMEGLSLQREFESKLQQQVASLLMPLLGEGNFSSQVQVELDQSEVTSAREVYDKDGALRSENERTATRSAGARTGGVPGVTANTPPPDAQLVDEAPQGDEAAPQGEAAQVPGDTEKAVSRNYELDREVAVTSTRAGGLTKLSVAIAVSEEALSAAAPMTAEQLQSLVSAAVGADPQRGDNVEVVVGAFEPREMTPLAFYEEAWFATILRYSTALIAVLLVLLLAVRPVIKRVLGPDKNAKDKKKGKGEDTAEAEALTDGTSAAAGAGALQGANAGALTASYHDLPQQVELARKLAVSQPERAVEALQRMLEPPMKTGKEAAG